MVLVKNLKIFSSFYCRLNRPKKAFLDSKITKLKKSKFWYFSKGVSPYFSPKKLKFFHVLIFGKIRQENVFEDILRRKKAF